MIVREYSNSVNTTAEQLATQQAQQLELVVAYPEETPAMALYPPIAGVKPSQRFREFDVDTTDKGRTWQWIARARRVGYLDRFSTERFTNLGEAACAAVRMARCHGVGVSQDVENVIRQERLRGDEIAFNLNPIEKCRNDAQRAGYLACDHTVEDEVQAILDEKDAKPGLDAQQWPPDDDEAYYEEYGEYPPAVTCNAYGDPVYW